MTPHELTEQTIAAFAARQKDRNTPLEALIIGNWVPFTGTRPNWEGEHYRIAPFTLGNSINGHTLGEGEQWQSKDLWRAGMLNAGERPLLYQEKREIGDWYWNHEKWIQHGPDSDGVGRAVSDVQYLHKTTRPLPSAQLAHGSNPDRLTCAQVGTKDGWRLLDKDEAEAPHSKNAWRMTEYRSYVRGWVKSENQDGESANGGTYRTRLTREQLAALDAPPVAKKPEQPQWTPEASRALHEKAKEYSARSAAEAANYNMAEAGGLKGIAGCLRIAANVMDGVSAS